MTLTLAGLAATVAVAVIVTRSAREALEHDLDRDTRGLARGADAPRGEPAPTAGRRSL
jgi:hypothetical protein